jgi:hypothetical protein
MWVAGGTGTNVLAYSYDGINWNGIPDVQTSISSTLITCTGITWISGLWIATNGSDYATSPDGINWSGYSSVPASQIISLASNGTKAIGIPYQFVSTLLSYTTDGILWNNIGDATLLAEGVVSYSDILWDGTKYITLPYQSAAGINTKFYSFDGITWTGSSVVQYTNPTNIGNLGTTLYISRGQNPSATEKSTDGGITWSVVTNPVVTSFPVTNGIQGTVFGTDRYILVAGFSNNSFIYTSDGNSWVLSTTGLAGNFKAGFFKK